MKDYYNILGINKGASDDEIKKAYRKACIEHHPDKHVSESKEEQKKYEEMFKDDAEAYEVLSDSTKKSNYDKYGDPNGPNMDDIGFNPFNPFSGFGSYGRGDMKEVGKDLRISISLSIAEIYTGVHKKIKIKKEVTCHRCHGSGSESNETTKCTYCNGTGIFTEVRRMGMAVMQSQTTCPHCHGTGTMIKDPCKRCHGSGLEEQMEDVEFDIPAGMINDSYCVIPNLGSMGPHRGVPGKLLIQIKELPNDKGLERDDNQNVYYTLKLDYTDLVYGKIAEIPYMIGYKQLDIKSGTQSGEKIVLRGSGMPNPNDGNYKGDYIITVECSIPKLSELDSKRKELLKKLKNLK